MRIAIHLSVLLFGLTSAIHACKSGNMRVHGTQEGHGAQGGHGAHWSYDGETGPAHWGDLDPAYAACKSGKSQTPIDITGTKGADLAALVFSYQEVGLKIIDNGHTIQVNYPPGSTIGIRGKTYNLLQFHFHAKSENTVGGKHYDMEMHLVHRDASGSLAVVAVFLESGDAAHGEIEKIWSNLPTDKGKEVALSNVQIDASRLLPTGRTYYHFTGSLTTPPCTEGVDWNVMRDPIKISADQLRKFEALYDGNYRPVQPLMDRTVALSE